MKRPRALALGLLGLVSAACGGQKLVGIESTTGGVIAKASAGDVPPTTTGTHGGTTTGTTASSTSGGHTTSSTSGTTTGTTTSSTTSTSSTSGCNTGPDLSLSNPWTMQSQYNLQQAGLPTLDAIVTDISTALNTINTLGIFAVPPQILQIFDILSSLDVFFQQLNVTSTLTFTPTGTPGLYNVAETWIDVTSTDGSGNVVDLSGGQITAAAVNGYTATVCNGTIAFSSHSIGTNLQGLITPILDGAVALFSQGQYMTFSSLISYVFNDICSSFNPITQTAAYLACTGYLSNSLQTQIYQAVNTIGVDLASATIDSGTGQVEAPFPPPLIDMGMPVVATDGWKGHDRAGTFNGTFVINGT